MGRPQRGSTARTVAIPNCLVHGGRSIAPGCVYAFAPMLAEGFLRGVRIGMPLELLKRLPPGMEGEEIAKYRERSKCHATNSRAH